MNYYSKRVDELLTQYQQTTDIADKAVLMARAVNYSIEDDIDNLWDGFVSELENNPRKWQTRWHIVTETPPVLDPNVIANNAYQLWEQAGKPECDGVEFWLEAERQMVENYNTRTGCW